MKEIKRKYPNASRKFVVTEKELLDIVDYVIEQSVACFVGAKKLSDIKKELKK